MISFRLTKAEAEAVLVAVGMCASVLDTPAKEKYDEAYKVLISQYAAQTVGEVK